MKRFVGGIHWECEKAGRWKAQGLPLRCIHMMDNTKEATWEVHVSNDKGELIEFIGHGLTFGEAVTDATLTGLKCWSAMMLEANTSKGQWTLRRDQQKAMDPFEVYVGD